MHTETYRPNGMSPNALGTLLKYPTRVIQVYCRASGLPPNCVANITFSWCDDTYKMSFFLENGKKRVHSKATGEVLVPLTETSIGAIQQATYNCLLVLSVYLALFLLA